MPLNLIACLLFEHSLRTGAACVSFSPFKAAVFGCAQTHHPNHIVLDAKRKLIYLEMNANNNKKWTKTVWPIIPAIGKSVQPCSSIANPQIHEHKPNANSVESVFASAKLCKCSNVLLYSVEYSKTAENLLEKEKNPSI